MGWILCERELPKVVDCESEPVLFQTKSGSLDLGFYCEQLGKKYFRIKRMRSEIEVDGVLCWTYAPKRYVDNTEKLKERAANAINESDDQRRMSVKEVMTFISEWEETCNNIRK